MNFANDAENTTKSGGSTMSSGLGCRRSGAIRATCSRYRAAFRIGSTASSTVRWPDASLARPIPLSPNCGGTGRMKARSIPTAISR